MSDIILKAENLHFSYDDGDTFSLNGLTLSIKKGAKVAVMGANGSGKSTFFLCCNGILRPDKGQLFYDGVPFSYHKKALLDLRSKVGIVFQNPDSQLFSASVYQEISFGILNLGVSEAKAKQEVENVIELLEITPFRDKPAHALSGGEKKQVSLADILVMHPEIILLDEPAASLDPKHTAIIHQFIDQLCENGTTVIIATHDANYALNWADDLILLKDGRVMAQGEPLDILKDARLLSETNLEVPAVLKLFDSLCKKQMLPTSLPAPKNLAALEDYILNIK